MIYGIFGVNGAGKTLTMTHELTKYDIVFCNYNYKGLNTQLVVVDPDTTKLFYKLIALVKHITTERILKDHIKIAFAIDEAGITFPAREWKKMSSEEAYLFAQHRKLGGMDFWYTSQNPFMVDRTLRLNTAIGVYPGHLFNFFWVKWYYGALPRKDFFLYMTFYLRTKELTSLYNTYEEVASSKYYFSDPSEHIDVLQYLQSIDNAIVNIKDKKLADIFKLRSDKMDQVLQQYANDPENSNNNNSKIP